MLRMPRSDAAHETASRIGEARPVATPDELEHRNRDEADDRIERLLEAASGDQHVAQEARVHRPDVSERDDDLAEHLAALKACEAALELAERNLGIDHRQHAGRHLGQALANVAHGSAERADDAILLLKELHQ